MFAGLNVFRYLVARALEITNFEFSETYLFFWDKLERSNMLLQWYIDHPEVQQSDRVAEYMSPAFLTDGGWWNYFANLVTKYGVVPKAAMNETYQSWMSEGMNEIVCDRLMATVCQIQRLQQRGSANGQRPNGPNGRSGAIAPTQN